MDSEQADADSLYVYGKALYNLDDFYNSNKYLNKAVDKDGYYNDYAECREMLKITNDVTNLINLYSEKGIEEKFTKDVIDMWYTLK